MIRIQAQLTEEQARRLREIAGREGVSVAELLRRGADHVLSRSGASDPEQRRERALAVVGRYADEEADVAERHDRYLDEAIGP